MYWDTKNARQQHVLFCSYSAFSTYHRKVVYEHLRDMRSHGHLHATLAPHLYDRRIDHTVLARFFNDHAFRLKKEKSRICAAIEIPYEIL